MPFTGLLGGVLSWVGGVSVANSVGMAGELGVGPPIIHGFGWARLRRHLMVLAGVVYCTLVTSEHTDMLFMGERFGTCVVLMDLYCNTVLK